MSLRIRTAIVAIIGVLLIPVATSSLRGLTHVITCSSPLSAGFDVAVPEAGAEPEAVLLDPTAVNRDGPDGPAVVTTATTVAPTTVAPTTSGADDLRREEAVPLGRRPVCGGITVDLRLSAPAPGVVRVDVPVRNRGSYDWQGTVRLRIGDKAFPVRIGSIPPGQTRTRSIEVAVDDEVDRVSGELLLGP